MSRLGAYAPCLSSFPSAAKQWPTNKRTKYKTYIHHPSLYNMMMIIIMMIIIMMIIIMIIITVIIIILIIFSSIWINL